MTLGSRVKTVWRVARNALARLNRLLAEVDDADDMVFHVRAATSARRSRDHDHCSARFTTAVTMTDSQFSV